MTDRHRTAGVKILFGAWKPNRSRRSGRVAGAGRRRWPGANCKLPGYKGMRCIIDHPYVQRSSGLAGGADFSVMAQMLPAVRRRSGNTF